MRRPHGAILVILAIVPSAVPAEVPRSIEEREGRIVVEAWALDDRILHPDGDVAERLLDEARTVLSGMVYGWSFLYRPPDRRREVDDVFELTLLGEIAPGDPGLTALELARDGPTHFGAFEFRTDRSQRRSLAFWRSFSQNTSAGVGRAPLVQGLAGRRAALDDALRDAVHAGLRFQYQNRPREARGSIALARPPIVRTDAGDYVYRVEVVIILGDVRPYFTF